MALIRADHAPAWGPNDLHWPDSETSVEVEGELANELLRIPGFRDVTGEASHRPTKAVSASKRTPVNE